MPFGPVDPTFDLVALEEQVLARLARPGRHRRVPPTAGRRRAVDLLRGTADRQRPARPAPRLGPGVQGPLPPLPDHARSQRAPQGRLGLPRPARGARGGEGARPPLQARDRGLRGGRVQPALPRLGPALRRGLVGPDHPIGHLDRHRRRLLDAVQRLRRVGVVAAVAAVGEGAAVRGPQGLAVLRPVRYRPVVPRAGPARRVPRRHRPLGLRPLPAGGQRLGHRRRRPAGVDHHTVDAHLQRGRRRRARHRLRPGAGRGHGLHRPRPGGGRPPAARRGASRSPPGRATSSPVSTTGGRSPSSTSRPAPMPGGWWWPTTSAPTTAPASSTRPPPSARRTRPSPGPRSLPGAEPGRRRRGLRRSHHRRGGACSSRTPTRASSRTWPPAACSCASSPTSTATPTAGGAGPRSSTGPRRPGSCAPPPSATC